VASGFMPGQEQKCVPFFSFYSPFKNHVARIKNIGDKVILPENLQNQQKIKYEIC
jgi:hypothetical protein